MCAIPLTTRTGILVVDDVLQNIIGTYERAFPQRIRGYYLIGSYVEQTAVPLSDIDLFVIFADTFSSAAEETAARECGHQCAITSPLRLDIGVYPECDLSALHPVIRIALKAGSQLLFGTDIRERIPVPPISDYCATLIEGARYFIALPRKMTQITTATVDYPDAPAPYFGYTRKSVDAWYPPAIAAGTKELVAATSRIASAIVANETHQYVPGKRAAITLFQAVGGDWSSFAYQIYHQCKLEWQYRIPATKRKQQQLHQLCRDMLAFENMFLQKYS